MNPIELHKIGTNRQGDVVFQTVLNDEELRWQGELHKDGGISLYSTGAPYAYLRSLGVCGQHTSSDHTILTCTPAQFDAYTRLVDSFCAKYAKERVRCFKGRGSQYLTRFEGGKCVAVYRDDGQDITYAPNRLDYYANHSLHTEFPPDQWDAEVAALMERNKPVEVEAGQIWETEQHEEIVVLRVTFGLVEYCMLDVGWNAVEADRVEVITDAYTYTGKRMNDDGTVMEDK
jgi:hypothetical protein